MNKLNKKIKKLKIIDNFFYNIFSGILILLSFVFFTITFVNYSKPIKEIDWVKIKNDSFSKCRNFIKEKEYNVKIDEYSGTITIKKIDLNEPTVLIVENENILSKCDNFELVDFCIGDQKDCGIFGITSTFKYNKPNKK